MQPQRQPQHQPRHTTPLPARGLLLCGRSGSSTALAAPRPPCRRHPPSADSLDRDCAASAWAPCSAADHRDLHQDIHQMMLEHVVTQCGCHTQHLGAGSTVADNHNTVNSQSATSGVWSSVPQRLQRVQPFRLANSGSCSGAASSAASSASTLLSSLPA